MRIGSFCRPVFVFEQSGNSVVYQLFEHLPLYNQWLICSARLPTCFPQGNKAFTAERLLSFF